MSFLPQVAGPASISRAARKLFPFSVAESEDMAAIAVFLASDESRAVTGVVIPADGGRSACFKLYVPEV